jgi:hypothetical protein
LNLRRCAIETLRKHTSSYEVAKGERRFAGGVHMTRDLLRTLTVGTAFLLWGSQACSGDDASSSSTTAGESSGGDAGEGGNEQKPPSGGSTTTGGSAATGGGGHAGSGTTPSAGAAGESSGGSPGASGTHSVVPEAGAAGTPSEGGMSGATHEPTGGAGFGGAGAGGAAGVGAEAGSGGDGSVTVLPEGCDYVEQDDVGNGESEVELIDHTLLGSFTICGQIDVGHYEADSSESVDVDYFTFDVATREHVLVELQLQADPPGSFETVFGEDYVHMDLIGKSGVIGSQLHEGLVSIAVGAFDAQDASQPIPYRLKITQDTPDTRCPAVTTAANYVEALDGAANSANDVYQVDDNGYVVATDSATDAPEATGITVASGAKYRITGSTADVQSTNGYLDPDTFVIHTGPTVNQITIRNDWSNVAWDFDFALMNAATEDVVGGGFAFDNTGELLTFSVKPDTTYWLWNAGFQLGAPLPAAYSLSLCGETFSF